MGNLSFGIFAKYSEVAYKRTDSIYSLMETKHTVKSQVNIETVFPLPTYYRCRLDLGEIHIIE